MATEELPNTNQPPHDSISGEGSRAVSRGRGTHSLDRAEEAVEKRAGTAASTSSDSGAPPSNTAPSKYIKPKILRSGIDSLYLSYLGSLKEPIETELEKLKLCAQSTEPADQALASVLVADHSFRVDGRGKGRFPFILSNNQYHMQLSRARSTSMPMMMAQLSSELLTLSGADSGVRVLNNLASVLGWDHEFEKVSRVDLCLDLDLVEELPRIPLEHILCRSKHKTIHVSGTEFSGISFGIGGDIMCRVYNKSLEIREKSKKEFFYEVWGACEATGMDVWRVEFQFKRNILRELGVNSYSDLVKKQNSLWDYATNWLRFEHPVGNDTNRSRWKTYPFWKIVQAANFNEEPRHKLRRISKSEKPNDDFLFVNGLGSLTSYMADKGIEDIDEALPLYLNDCRKHHLGRSRTSGKTLNTYVREKVAQKQQKFAIKPKGQKHVPTELSGEKHG
jgi:hypothetical protein